MASVCLFLQQYNEPLGNRFEHVNENMYYVMDDGSRMTLATDVTRVHVSIPPSWSNVHFLLSSPKMNRSARTFCVASVSAARWLLTLRLRSGCLPVVLPGVPTLIDASWSRRFM